MASHTFISPCGVTKLVKYILEIDGLVQDNSTPDFPTKVSGDKNIK